MNRPQQESETAKTSNQRIVQLALQPADNQRLANLCGLQNDHLKLIEQRLGVNLRNRGHEFQITGEARRANIAASLLEQLYKDTANEDLNPESIHLHLQEAGLEALEEEGVADNATQQISLRTPRITIKPRGSNQQAYVNTIRQQDINFGIGPAGTGKTYLAVACAVEALMKDEIRRILLVRPAVEAGEKLGFLPGDLAQKIDPYLRPLYDALYEMLGFEQVGKMIEKNVIEVAPLAFMRGRTLNNAFVILDESQNTTREQMKMFLTRIGFGTTAVITGDITQVDLPKGTHSGLIHVLKVLDEVQGIGITRFENRDVVRHPLVQRIVEAYDNSEEAEEIERQAREAQRQEERAQRQEAFINQAAGKNS
ncbi:phosphate starvation-inducible protein PhoH [Marinospirillum celere]|uniref:PhoH-like protein n=1 Tax=Marinospirillum celere TaxID=1122252 RepID=A0A1I1GQ22_9GAMM|nr:PhoH family protein [Marinospirillum celere]SFC11988.1 phosphate starvation-inducible protein PhoH [Marinospirillum celere]